VRVLFLDIKEAYDNINSSILFDIVNTMEILIHYKNFIRNFNNYRYANFYKNSKYYESRILHKGLPQGLTFNPFLFNLFIKNILKYIPYDCKTIQFTDNIVITSYKDYHKIINSLQLGFNQIWWLESLGLELSLAKPSLCYFIDLRIKPYQLNIN